MDAGSLQRFARHITLPQIGADGQERLLAARVLVAGGDLAAEVAARYLRAAGVGAVETLGGDSDGIPWPVNGAAWVAVLEDARPDLIVRSGFDDDAMLGALRRLGIPAVVVRAQADLVDLLSFPRRPPAVEAPLDTPAVRAPRARNGAAAVVAGALAAAEALHVLVGRAPRPAARHLRIPLDGEAPLAQEIPWG